MRPRQALSPSSPPFSRPVFQRYYAVFRRTPWLENAFELFFSLENGAWSIPFLPFRDLAGSHPVPKQPAPIPISNKYEVSLFSGCFYFLPIFARHSPRPLFSLSARLIDCDSFPQQRYHHLFSISFFVLISVARIFFFPSRQ